MSKHNITNADLKIIGIKNILWLKEFGRLAKKIMATRKLKKVEVLDCFKDLLNNPDSYTTEPDFKSVVELVIKEKTTIIDRPVSAQEVLLRPQPLEYRIFGIENIEKEALEQMQLAMSLPVAKAGALMPDAHSGYGLPIGGVLATAEDIVIPYAVGVDIACRMCLSIFDIPERWMNGKTDKLSAILDSSTVFGVGNTNKYHINTELFDSDDWQATEFIKKHKNQAFSQLGTSGAGNHFAEFGVVAITSDNSIEGINSGNYLAVLSHSGSRGFGSEVATYYSKLASELVKLPKNARHLAWLDLKTEEGHEYWTAMQLAGRYASSNHHEIHRKIAKALGERPVAMIENHHNFAWKEKLPDGSNVIVHRKGATPASKNDVGIIPGSMTLPGYIIRGKGSPVALNSASHGAGRAMSRSKAQSSFTRSAMNKELEKYGVTLIGGDTDEAPFAYKNIETVMALQSELVEVLAKFQPRIVKMAEPEKRRWR